MATEETRATLDRALCIGMENYEAIADELFAQNVITHGPVENGHGREAWKQRQVSFTNAFSDFELTIMASLADGDMGAIRYTATGTHTGDFEDIAPTGKRITFSGATLFQVADGKVVEVWCPLQISLVCWNSWTLFPREHSYCTLGQKCATLPETRPRVVGGFKKIITSAMVWELFSGANFLTMLLPALMSVFDKTHYRFAESSLDCQASDTKDSFGIREYSMLNLIEGCWRITEMEMWEQDAIDLIGPGYFYFDAANRSSKFQFIAVEGFMDSRFTERKGVPAVEFSWEGNDELDSACGRGWAVLEGGVITGRIFIHQGDDSGLTAVPMRLEEG